MKTKNHNRHSRKALLAVALLASLTTYTAHAQSYTVIHNFSGGADGATPHSGLTPDGAGAYYGTTTYGGYQGQNCGNTGCGTVFKLFERNGRWIVSNLYSFQGGSDSAWPSARVVFGPDGALYGTTAGGNGNSCSQNGCGSVFRLAPPINPCHAISCPWIKTTLYRFSGPDGQIPGSGDLVFDQGGNIYGTTVAGGSGLWGTVYKLTRANGQWMESALYNFTGQGDGGNPVGGLTFDRAGNLWGTTVLGGLNSLPDFYGPGVLYELTPTGSGWSYATVYQFRDNTTDGGLPMASLTVASDGTMYGTSSVGGIGLCAYDTYYTGCGTIFTVAQQYEAPWFWDFANGGTNPGLSGSTAPVTLDATGNVYGTTVADGEFSAGTVFKITYPNRSYTSLRDLNGGTDGGNPSGNVIFDRAGNLFGTASAGGNSGMCTTPGGCGVIWEITP
jgi:hypothetical protein